MLKKIFPVVAITQHSALSFFIKSILGIFFLSLSSQINIPLPFTPVPLNLQTLVVTIIGLTASPVLAVTTTIGYTLLIIGKSLSLSLNVFTALTTLSTLGYLLGFILFSFCLSQLNLLKKPKNLLYHVALIALCHCLLIYLPGALYLHYWFSLSQHEVLSVANLLTMSVTPFLFGDILKIATALLLCKRYMKSTHS